MHRSRIDVLREVIITRTGTLGTHAAARLFAELAQRSTLDVAKMAHRDDDGIVGIEVLSIELMLIGDDFRATSVTVFVFYLLKILFHHLLATLGIVKNLLQVGYQLHQIVVFRMQLIDAQTRELCQTHVNNSLRLRFVQIETLLQIALCITGSLGIADDVYHLVNVVHRNDQAFKDMGTLLCLLQVELRTPDRYVVTMFHEVADTVLQVQQARTELQLIGGIRHQGNIVHREGALQCRHLEQFIEDDIGIGITPHVNNDAHTLSARLVVDVGDTLKLPFLHQIGNVLDELLFVHAVWNFRNDDLVVLVVALNFSLGTHDNTSAARFIGIFHALETIDIGTRREIRSGNILHQSLCVKLRIVYVSTAAIDNLPQVVGRHVRCHTYGNTVTAVDQQVRHLGRHDARLQQRVVEVVRHNDGVLFQVVHDVFTHLRQAALRVTHRCGRVTVDRTEVSLAVNELIAHVPLLSHAYQCTIYRAVAVRMILTEHLTYDARTFLVGIVTCIADAQHTIEDASVNGLETVAHIGQGTRHNHRHRIVDV